MGKHNKKKSSASKGDVRATLGPSPDAVKTKSAKEGRRRLLLSPYVVMFVLVWAWAAFWYGDVFRIAREFSFWAPDSTLMSYMEGRPWEALLCLGQMLLMLFRWPAVGALLVSALLTGSTYLLSYCLRLRGWWRLLQYIPAALYLGLTAYVGFDLYYQTETGRILGVPFLCFLVLLVIAVIIRSFSRHGMPPFLTTIKGESLRQNVAQTLVVVALVLIPVGISQWMRPYMRVVTRMQVQMMRQDWGAMAQTARDHAELSYRPIAAYYAIALVQRGEIGTRLFDIRMDYEDVYTHDYNGEFGYFTNYYQSDCDFYAGLAMTCIHHSITEMTLNGPSIQRLKLLAKSALLTNEWEVAEKYFAVLHRVPFEGKWLAKYEPMLRDTVAINRDPEFKMVLLTEPVGDIFEGNLVPPVFLGYNTALLKGKSINALWNSLAVLLYSKSMPDFIQRCRVMRGTTPPILFSEALMLMSSKYPEALQLFPGIEYQRDKLSRFATDVRPLLNDKQKYARELFPKYKGYYPYYYYFGNLKSTKKKTDQTSSHSGVN